MEKQLNRQKSTFTSLLRTAAVASAIVLIPATDTAQERYVDRSTAIETEAKDVIGQFGGVVIADYCGVQGTLLIKFSEGRDQTFLLMMLVNTDRFMNAIPKLESGLVKKLNDVFKINNFEFNATELNAFNSDVYHFAREQKKLIQNVMDNPDNVDTWTDLQRSLINLQYTGTNDLYKITIDLVRDSKRQEI